MIGSIFLSSYPIYDNLWENVVIRKNEPFIIINQLPNLDDFEYCDSDLIHYYSAEGSCINVFMIIFDQRVYSARLSLSRISLA